MGKVHRIEIVLTRTHGADFAFRGGFEGLEIERRRVADEVAEERAVVRDFVSHDGSLANEALADDTRAALVLARHEEDTAGFEEANLFLLADEAGELDRFLQTARGDFRGESIADVADEDALEVGQPPCEVLKGGEQVVDALLAVNAADPDGVVSAELFGHGVGRAEVKAVGEKRAAIRSHAERVEEGAPSSCSACFESVFAPSGSSALRERSHAANRRRLHSWLAQ